MATNSHFSLQHNETKVERHSKWEAASAKCKKFSQIWQSVFKSRLKMNHFIKIFGIFLPIVVQVKAINIFNGIGGRSSTCSLKTVNRFFFWESFRRNWNFVSQFFCEKSKKKSVEKSFENFKQNELIEYNGYAAETHEVTTEDGYILTIFRCNSKKPMPHRKKSVILQHGIVDSSDTFCLYPSQSLGELQKKV